MDTNTNQTLTKEGADWNAETYLGRLSCAYVNINYIAKILSITGGDSTNAKPMLDFLKAIIKDMTKSLGGINDIILKVSYTAPGGFTGPNPKNEQAFNLRRRQIEDLRSNINQFKSKIIKLT